MKNWGEQERRQRNTAKGERLQNVGEMGKKAAHSAQFPQCLVYGVCKGARRPHTRGKRPKSEWNCGSQ